MRRARSIWNCKPCHKRSYPTEARAYEAIDNHQTYHANRKLPSRAYECEYGNGWHLTSQPIRSNA